MTVYNGLPKRTGLPGNATSVLGSATAGMTIINPTQALKDQITLLLMF